MLTKSKFLTKLLFRELVGVEYSFFTSIRDWDFESVLPVCYAAVIKPIAPMIAEAP